MKSSEKQRSQDNTEGQRLDIWLWASRFYKSRKIATDAVKGGHVWVNRKRGKPSTMVSINDELRIKHFPYEYTVVVGALSRKRLGAPLARELYQETESSQRSRKRKQQQLRDQRAAIKYDRKRPGKRDRQKMLEIKTQNPEYE
jgi:ribosome-associated heat shock protein Hsp15